MRRDPRSEPAAPACWHRWTWWSSSTQFALRCQRCGAAVLLTQYAERVEAYLLPSRGGGVARDVVELVVRCLLALGVPEHQLGKAALQAKGSMRHLVLPGTQLPPEWSKKLGALPELRRAVA